MRFKLIFLVISFLFVFQLKAQNEDYPTLDALAAADVPNYDYTDMVQRISWTKTNFMPPTEPPDYQIGAQETLLLPTDDSYDEVEVNMELRALTDTALIWVQDSAPYTRSRAQRLAETIESQIVHPLHELFGFREPPGVDGDPRLYIAMILAPELSAPGFFLSWHTLASDVSDDSNVREMILINLDHDKYYDNFDQYLIEVIAHEFQHILLHHRDDNEEYWLDDAFSYFVEHYASGPGPGFDGVYQYANEFLAAPQTRLTNWKAGEELPPKFGAGALFLIYLAEQYGEAIIGRLHAEAADGWNAVDIALREAAGISADEAFADWVLANFFLDDDRGYGYRDIESLLTPPQPSTNLRSFPARHDGRLDQYSSEYIAVNVHGADKLVLKLKQEDEARLIDTAPFEGEHMIYAVAETNSNPKLTREFDLDGALRAVLTFRVWYDFWPHREFAYVEVSTDGGKTWELITGQHTVPESRYGRFYDKGYTGASRVWLQERVNLSRFARQKFLLRFETYSERRTNFLGMAIDDLRIEGTDFADGFESADDAWIADGWIRTDNRLPNNTWLQVAQDTDSGLHVSRARLSGPGELVVDLLPGASRTIIAISPVVPATALPTDYTLELDLLDEAGNILEVSRSCSVTTTTALNFRATPGGDRIGLLPGATTVDALERQGDWFRVDYKGVIGWVSAGYVSTQGNCP